MTYHLPITRRGGFRLLIGTIYAVVGFANATQPASSQTTTYATAEAVLGLAFWSTIWCMVGLAAIVSAVIHPRGHDSWGFYLLIGWSAFWGGMCCASTLVFGADRGWIAGAVWLTFAAACAIVSGMDKIGARDGDEDGTL